MFASNAQTRPGAVRAIAPRPVAGASRAPLARSSRLPMARRPAPRALSAEEATSGIKHELTYRVSPTVVEPKQLYDATAWSVHNQLVDGLDATNKLWSSSDKRHVYYLSAEFLMGRTLSNAVNNLGIAGPYAEALKSLGSDLEAAKEEEVDAALGNGGLGRLAACFLDSLATLDLPGWGYGIRYRYGMFKQGVDAEGRQTESPDYWLGEGGMPWEVRRPSISFDVGFYGEAGEEDAATGKGSWSPAETVIASACDVPIPGYATSTVGTLRLWDASAPEEFDLARFNVGDYEGAVEAKRKADDITAVLYPNDATPYGRELRLKQQFFFVSASLQDALARVLAKGLPASALPDHAIFQMNDTHPTIAVAELQRLLVDVHGLAWDEAKDVVARATAYTNHTVMPEALEKWPLAVLGKLLPRHAQIIARLNAEWLESVRPRVLEQLGGPEKAEELSRAAAQEEGKRNKDGKDRSEGALGRSLPPSVFPRLSSPDPVARALAPYSIITAEPWKPDEPLVNMAYLAVVGSKAVNGVAAIHSEIIKEDLFPQFVDVFPAKFQNKTNGVTPRRWLAWCNPELAALITETLGTDAWIKEADRLEALKAHADDPAFRARWREVKRARKAKLAARVKEVTGHEVPVDALFDVQVKRIHEYKRQLLNILHVISRYLELKRMRPEERAQVVPRVHLFGGKAASAYDNAKRIVALINAAAATINADPDVSSLLKVVFFPNYNVSEAEVIIPAAELSEHISTGGTEASGTSNMKFALNGSLIIGTLDGANIEIGEHTGMDNLFVFGVPAEDVPRLRAERKSYADYDPRFLDAVKAVKDGTFGQVDYLGPLVDSVSDMTKGNDWFLVANDFASYAKAQQDVDQLYKDQEEWTRRSILYTASNGFFSSDRTIEEYAKDIWEIQPLKQQ